MSNFIYGKTKESLLKGEINLISNQLKILLVDNTYTPSQNVHQYVSDVLSTSIKDRSDALLNVSVTLGVLDADDLIMSNYPGPAFNAVIGYQVGSSDANSRLIFYVDTATGLPFTGASSTSPVTIIWDNGANKIIAL
jgi:hypothetical protein